MMMLDGRKPVICEKPLAVSVKDVAAMIQAAKEKKLFLMEVSGWCVCGVHLTTSSFYQPVSLVCTFTGNVDEILTISSGVASANIG